MRLRAAVGTFVPSLLLAVHLRARGNAARYSILTMQ
ncbi:MAG: hypothetical protein ACI8WM_002368 [Burkholderiaceae bacterium]|jgi:hypothetical protein